MRPHFSSPANDRSGTGRGPSRGDETPRKHEAAKLPVVLAGDAGASVITASIHRAHSATSAISDETLLASLIIPRSQRASASILRASCLSSSAANNFNNAGSAANTHHVPIA